MSELRRSIGAAKAGEPERYVVLGLGADVADWRRNNGIPLRLVTAVTTTHSRALRGRSAPFTLVTLPSWASASKRVKAEVEENLCIIEACTPFELALTD